MKITADNRGRVALTKIPGLWASGLPGSEWEAKTEGRGITLKYCDPAAEATPGWVQVDNLKPEHIGQVIGVAWSSLGLLKGASIVYGATEPGLYGTLEWYLTGQLGHDVVRVKLAGSAPVDFENFGMFYVKNV